MSNSTENSLYPPEKLRFELGVAEEKSVRHARVRVTLLGNGAQPTYPGSQLTVNGRTLQEKPLSKQGVWYSAEVPLAESYEFAYTLSGGQSVMAHRQSARAFSAELPAEVSRSQGLRLPFLLEPPSTDDGFELEFRPEQAMRDPRAIRFKPTVEDGRLIVPSAELARLPPGPASLLVGWYSGTARKGAVSSRHAVLYRRQVVVND